MDLEQRLRQIATANAEAARIARETEEAEALVRRQREEEQTQQEREKNLTDQIAATDAQIAETETLLAQLEGANEAAQKNLDASKELLTVQKPDDKEIEGLLEKLHEDEEVGPVLKAEGIITKEDLLANEDFQDTNQVKTYQHQVRTYQQSQNDLAVNKIPFKTNIQERSAVKDAVRAALQEDYPEIGRTYGELHDGLQKRLESLRVKRQELFEQTPEGILEQQEKGKELLKSKFKEARSRLGNYKDTPYEIAKTAREAGKSVTEQEKALYGEDFLKTEQEQLVRDITDKQAQEKFYAQNPGYKERQELLERIDKLPEDIRALREGARSLLEKEQHFAEKCGSLFDENKNPKAEDFKIIFAKNLGLNHRADTDQIIKHLLIKAEAVPLDFRAHDGTEFGRSSYAKMFSEYLLSVVRDPSMEPYALKNDMYEKAKTGSTLNKPDPESLLIMATKQEQHLDVLIGIVSGLGDEPDKDQLVSAANGLNNFFGKPVYDVQAKLAVPTLSQRYALPRDVEMLKREMATATATLESLKEEAFEAVVAASGDWEAIEKYEARLQNPQERMRIDAISQAQAKWESVTRIVKKFKETESSFKPSEKFEGDPAFIRPYGYEQKRADMIQVIKNLEMEIASLQDKIAEELKKPLGMDILGNKKKAQAETIKTIQTEIASKRTRLASNERELNAHVNLDRKYDQLNETLRQLKDVGPISMVDGMSANELFAQIEKLPDTLKPSPEDTSTLEEYKAIQKEADAARDRMRKG